MFDIKALYPPGISENIETSVAGIISGILEKSCFSGTAKKTLCISDFCSNCRSPKCWTLKLDGRAGTYGLSVKDIEDTKGLLKFSLGLKYFPACGEKVFNNFTIAEIMTASNPLLPELVRDFTALQEFGKMFDIGVITVRMAKEAETFSLSLRALTASRITIKEGIFLRRGDEVKELVPPRGLDRNVPSYRLALPLFKALAGACAYATDSCAGEIYKTAEPAFERTVTPKGLRKIKSDTVHLVTLTLRYNCGRVQSKAFAAATQYCCREADLPS